MKHNLNKSSKEILKKVFEQRKDFDFNKFSKGIEDSMEEFDLEKKVKAAKAVDDLSKLIITI